MRTPEHDPASPRRAAWLWLGILGPPLIWLLQFEFKYALAARTMPGARAAVIAASLVSLIAVGACGLTASRQHRLAAASPLDRFARTVPRTRFMAMLGVMSSGLFALLIIGQFLADLFIEPGLQ
jgi:hypothetical protein